MLKKFILTVSCLMLANIVVAHEIKHIAGILISFDRDTSEVLLESVYGNVIGNNNILYAKNVDWAEKYKGVDIKLEFSNNRMINGAIIIDNHTKKFDGNILSANEWLMEVLEGVKTNYGQYNDSEPSKSYTWECKNGSINVLKRAEANGNFTISILYNIDNINENLTNKDKINSVKVVEANEFSLIKYNDSENHDLFSHRIKYDSTENFVGILMYQYQGQSLTVRRNTDLINKGYKGFLRSPLSSEFDASNIYSKSNAHPNYYATPYYDLVDRTFYVKSCNQNKFYLVLEDALTKEVLYFKYNYAYRGDFPFIVHGYVEKLQRNTIGQTYYARSANLNNNAYELDETIDTNGQAFSAIIGSEWQVTDVFVSKKNFMSSVVFRMKSDRREIDVENEHFNSSYFGNKEVFDRIKESEGEKVFVDVLNKTYRIGMTRSSVRLALSNQPVKINVTEIGNNNVSEQWVLQDNKYLYFENGILSAIQY